MSEAGSHKGPRGQKFGPGEGPQLLAHLQGTGAEVVGNDGEKVGDLKAVQESVFTVGGSMWRDLHGPINRIGEVTAEGNIVLDIPAGQVEETDWEKSWSLGGPSPEEFSEAPREESIWEVVRRRVEDPKKEREE